MIKWYHDHDQGVHDQEVDRDQAEVWVDLEQLGIQIHQDCYDCEVDHHVQNPK